MPRAASGGSKSAVVVPIARSPSSSPEATAPDVRRLSHPAGRTGAGHRSKRGNPPLGSVCCGHRTQLLYDGKSVSRVKVLPGAV